MARGPVSNVRAHNGQLTGSTAYSAIQPAPVDERVDQSRHRVNGEALTTASNGLRQTILEVVNAERHNNNKQLSKLLKRNDKRAAKRQSQHDDTIKDFIKNNNEHLDDKIKEILGRHDKISQGYIDRQKQAAKTYQNHYEELNDTYQKEYEDMNAIHKKGWEDMMQKNQDYYDAMKVDRLNHYKDVNTKYSKAMREAALYKTCIVAIYKGIIAIGIVVVAYLLYYDFSLGRAAPRP
ncbi:hypothetical protein GGS26DRAFT_592877 [Hypomontagnella submonticulosa]|nr:hypothetical protein GGS26DRAFT_592877 [Hypomontagnella submonticulosa]